MAGANDLALMQAMLPYAQPATYPTIRRSQLLADALSDMREKGGQNLRTPTALWGNLGAMALLTGAREKNFKDLDKSLRGDMQSTVETAAARIPGWNLPKTAPMGPSSAPGQMPAMQDNPIDAGPPGASPAPVQQASLPPAQTGGIPTQPILPQEIATAKALINSGNPVLIRQGMEMVAELRKRSLTPIDPSKPAFISDGNGGYQVRDLGKEVTTTPGQRPGTEIQTVNATGEKKMFDPGIAGAQPPGTVYRGGYNEQVPTILYNGQLAPAGAGSTAEQQKIMEDFFAPNKDYAKYITVHTKLQGLKDAFKAGPNAVTGLMAADVLQEVLNGSPNLATTQGMVEEVKGLQGVLSSIKTQIQNGVDPGSILIPPKIIQDIIRVGDFVDHDRYIPATRQLDLAGKTAESAGVPIGNLPIIPPSFLHPGEPYYYDPEHPDRASGVQGRRPSLGPATIAPGANRPSMGSRPALGGDQGVAAPNPPASASSVRMRYNPATGQLEPK